MVQLGDPGRCEGSNRQIAQLWLKGLLDDLPVAGGGARFEARVDMLGHEAVQQVAHLGCIPLLGLRLLRRGELGGRVSAERRPRQDPLCLLACLIGDSLLAAPIVCRR